MRAIDSKLDYAKYDTGRTIRYIGSKINTLQQRHRADLLAREPTLFAWIAQTLDRESPVLSAAELNAIDQRATELARVDGAILPQDQMLNGRGVKIHTARICDGTQLEHSALQFVEWLAVERHRDQRDGRLGSLANIMPGGQLRGKSAWDAGTLPANFARVPIEVSSTFHREALVLAKLAPNDANLVAGVCQKWSGAVRGAFAAPDGMPSWLQQDILRVERVTDVTANQVLGSALASTAGPRTIVAVGAEVQRRVLAAIESREALTVSLTFDDLASDRVREANTTTPARNFARDLVKSSLRANRIFVVAQLRLVVVPAPSLLTHRQNPAIKIRRNASFEQEQLAAASVAAAAMLTPPTAGVAGLKPFMRSAFAASRRTAAINSRHPPITTLATPFWREATTQRLHLRVDDGEGAILNQMVWLFPSLTPAPREVALVGISDAGIAVVQQLSRAKGQTAFCVDGQWNADRILTPAFGWMAKMLNRDDIWTQAAQTAYSASRAAGSSTARTRHSWRHCRLGPTWCRAAAPDSRSTPSPIRRSPCITFDCGRLPLQGSTSRANGAHCRRLRRLPLMSWTLCSLRDLRVCWRGRTSISKTEQ